VGEVTPINRPRPEAPLTPPAALASHHDVSKFDCGKPALNDWLRQWATKNEGKTARCFVTCIGRQVVGYYCISAGAVERAHLPKKLKPHGTPNSVPVIIIGRLAIDQAVQGMGIGKALLKDALLRILNASMEVGARGVLVHAVDNDVVPFYANFGFMPFPTDSKTLFLPIETIAAAL
jgi:GNAT superfamily N-acetyltransferase